MLHVSNMSSYPLTLTILMAPTNQTAAEYTGVVRISRKDFVSIYNTKNYGSGADCTIYFMQLY